MHKVIITLPHTEPKPHKCFFHDFTSCPWVRVSLSLLTSFLALNWLGALILVTKPSLARLLHLLGLRSHLSLYSPHLVLPNSASLRHVCSFILPCICTCLPRTFTSPLCPSDTAEVIIPMGRAVHITLHHDTPHHIAPNFRRSGFVIHGNSLGFTPIPITVSIALVRNYVFTHLSPHCAVSSLKTRTTSSSFRVCKPQQNGRQSRHLTNVVHLN